MAYYVKAPVLRTRVIETARFLGPQFRTGRVTLTTPTWMGAQEAMTPVVATRLWGRIPVRLVEGVEPIPAWDVLSNRRL